MVRTGAAVKNSIVQGEHVVLRARASFRLHGRLIHRKGLHGGLFVVGRADAARLVGHGLAKLPAKKSPVRLAPTLEHVP
jgi:hypothetical protein